jgi:predicted RNA-binding Zn ribbon-like protein
MNPTPTTAPLLGEPLPVELMNTIWADRDGVHDALGDPEGTAAWIRAIAARDDAPDVLLPAWWERVRRPEVAEAHQDLRALRDAARRLAARLTEDTRPAAQAAVEASTALATVNRYAATARSWPVLAWPEGGGAPRRSIVSESGPGATLVADLARATVSLLDHDGGASLRACQAPGCVLYFVKQHPRREWCSAACGNRARQARHYRRHHGER